MILLFFILNRSEKASSTLGQTWLNIVSGQPQIIPLTETEPEILKNHFLTTKSSVKM